MTEKPVARRQIAHATEAGGPKQASMARVMAFKRIFSGKGDQRDADIVLSDLSVFVGLHRRPAFGEVKGETAESFMLRSALANARVEVVQHIFEVIELSDDVLVALEKAARAEAQG